MGAYSSTIVELISETAYSKLSVLWTLYEEIRKVFPNIEEIIPNIIYFENWLKFNTEKYVVLKRRLTHIGIKNFRKEMGIYEMNKLLRVSNLELIKIFNHLQIEKRNLSFIIKWLKKNRCFYTFIKREIIQRKDSVLPKEEVIPTDRKYCEELYKNDKIIQIGNIPLKIYKKYDLDINFDRKKSKNYKLRVDVFRSCPIPTWFSRLPSFRFPVMKTDRKIKLLVIYEKYYLHGRGESKTSPSRPFTPEIVKYIINMVKDIGIIPIIVKSPFISNEKLIQLCIQDNINRWKQQYRNITNKSIKNTEILVFESINRTKYSDAFYDFRIHSYKKILHEYIQYSNIIECIKGINTWSETGYFDW